MVKAQKRFTLGQLIKRLSEWETIYGSDIAVVVMASGYHDINMVEDETRYDHKANDIGGDELTKIVIHFDDEVNDDFIKPYDTAKAKRRFNKLYRPASGTGKK